MTPYTYMPHAIGTILLGALGWLGKRFGDHVANRLNHAESKLDEIHTVVTVQAENHLKTIQENTAKTNDLLNEIRVEMALQSGYLKGIVSKG